MKLYNITANFCGYIGCNETYSIWADSEEEAMEQAREMALDDMSFEVESVEDDEE